MNKKKSQPRSQPLSKMRSLFEDKRGAGLMDLPMNLMVLYIAVTFLVALIPGFVEIIDQAQQSDNLNCVGYKYQGCDADSCVLSYNSSIGTKSSIGCMAIKLYIPYVVLGVLIAGVALIFYGRSMGEMGFG